MDPTPILLQPGVTTQETPRLNMTRWALSRLIRFKDGLLEKRGGWAKFSSIAFEGICRGLKAWLDLTGNFYLAAGTNKRLLLYTSDNRYDITPIRKTSGVMGPFTTDAGSTSVLVHDPGHDAIEGDGILVVTPAAVDEVLIFGFYDITGVPDADHYTITIADPAAAGVVSGGDTAEFTSTNGSADVNVHLENHGFAVDEIYTTYVATSFGGLTLLGEYPVTAVTDVDNFTIPAETLATSDDTANENGGSVRIAYLLAPGGADAQPAQGFGIGGFGEGTFGFGVPSTTFEPPRQWFMEAWGEDLLAVPSNGTLYVWQPSFGLFNNSASEIASAPDIITAMFLAMPQRQLVLLGAEDDNVQDKLLIKYSDIDDYTYYRDVGSPAVAGKQAGWYRLPRGNAIIGGIQAPQSGLIWTDLALWTMFYIGTPFIYGFVEIATGCGLIAPRAMGIIGGITMWLSPSGYFIYDGSSARPVPCDVWDEIFPKLNTEQIQKITCAPNSLFREFEWHIPTTDDDGGEVNVSVKYTLDGGVWDFSPDGAVPRTAWIDQNVWGNPIGAGPDGYLYQHEIGTDADDAAMNAYAESGWICLNDGEDFVFIERLTPNFKLRGNGAIVLITIKMKEYAADESAENPVTTFGPYTVNSLTTYAIVRGRNRFASIKYESNDLGSFWRQGKTTINAWPDGRR